MLQPDEYARSFYCMGKRHRPAEVHAGGGAQNDDRADDLRGTEHMVEGEAINDDGGDRMDEGQRSGEMRWQLLNSARTLLQQSVIERSSVFETCCMRWKPSRGRKPGVHMPTSGSKCSTGVTPPPVG